MGYYDWRETDLVMREDIVEAVARDRYRRATLELSSRGIDRSVPGEPMSKQDIMRRRLEGATLYMYHATANG